nr:unnamed protein product [Digitaria exilis]
MRREVVLDKYALELLCPRPATKKSNRRRAVKAPCHALARADGSDD